jgi:glycosyltransferase involved in cell wall biosynthesis
MDFLSDKNTSLMHGWRRLYKSSVEKLRITTPEIILNIKAGIIAWRERNTILQNQEILRQILIEKQSGINYREIMLFPPGLDWTEQLFQRPQQLALAFAKQGALVFYVEPKPDHSKQPFQLISERLYLCPVHIDTFKSLSNPIIYLLPWNKRYNSRLNHPRILYDYLDDLNAFYGNRRKIIDNHHYYLENADYVLATARKLVQEVQPLRDDVIFSPNGVDYELFSRAAQEVFTEPPADLQAVLSKSEPIIGYYGALARWFDYHLIKSVAELRPDYQFVLIGPDFDDTVELAKVNEIKNIYWLETKTYKELPHYLKYFDVATIPFIVNEITHATSPLKLFEYMAGEKPIVITPMQESMQYPGVLIGKDPIEFAQQIDRALSMRDDQGYQSLLRKTAQENTWVQRAEDILKIMENKRNLLNEA